MPARLWLFTAWIALACICAPLAQAQEAGTAFRNCIDGLRPRAAAAGVTTAMFEAAFAGVTPEPSILAAPARQSEFVQPIWGYIEAAATPARIARGKALAQTHRAMLADIERRYGVDRRTVMGVWGMESNFGSQTGGVYVVRALATLYCAGHRGELFGDELVAAMRILQAGHIGRDDMRGSWAGAMGQTQFLPSSYLSDAVDYDGDGTADIWRSVPDALASTANYLANHGWRRGLPWGFEVLLPDGFPYAGYGRSTLHGFDRWRALGVKRADGGAFPAAGEAGLYLPTGARGPAFLITANFQVIKAYNTSDSYALSVGHLGDRIFGAPALHAVWPKRDAQLTRSQRIDLQRRLTALGHDVGTPNGLFGERTAEAVRAYQASRGLLADSYATPALLDRLKREP